MDQQVICFIDFRYLESHSPLAVINLLIELGAPLAIDNLSGRHIVVGQLYWTDDYDSNQIIFRWHREVQSGQKYLRVRIRGDGKPEFASP